MLSRSGESDRHELLKFLHREEAYNTFIIADIDAHGFDAGYQRVYHQRDDKGCINNVVLTFFNNLIIAGAPDRVDFAAVAALLADGTDTVMGKAEILSGLTVNSDVSRLYPSRTFSDQRLYSLATSTRLAPATPGFRIATAADTDAVYDFLMSISEFRSLYANKGMLDERLSTGSGTDVILEGTDGEILAHVNTTARTRQSVMIGGLAVAPTLRGRGYAKRILSEVCRHELTEGRVPCLFSKRPGKEAMYPSIGFEQIGRWGVIELNRERIATNC